MLRVKHDTKLRLPMDTRQGNHKSHHEANVMSNPFTSDGDKTPAIQSPEVVPATQGNFLPNPLITPEGVVAAVESDDTEHTESSTKKEAPFDTIEREMELFTDPNDNRYATVTINGVKHNYEIGGKNHNEAVSLRYYELTSDLPDAKSLKKFNDKLRFKARYNSSVRDTFLRFAFIDGEIYVDLCNLDGQAVHITPNGWELVANPPVNFIRQPHMQPLPVPARGGNYLDILNFLNIKREDDKLLVLTWPLVATITPIPRAILLLYGSPGACKSSSISVLRGMIDPSYQMHTYVQKTVNEAALYLAANAIPTFDNLSEVSKDVENILCMAVTGGGISKRKLYTDTDSVILQIKRAVIITSLDIPTSASDLLDRTIAVELERIPPDKRLADDAVKRDYAAKLPGILGGMYDALVQMLTLHDKVSATVLPRMADYAQWACAAASALGFSEEDFIKAYSRASLRVQNDALEDEGFANTLIDYLDMQGETSGFAAKVLDALRVHTDQMGLPSEVLPKMPNMFSRRLKQIIPLLEISGWKVEFSSSTRRGRTVSFRRISAKAQTSESTATDSPMVVAEKVEGAALSPQSVSTDEASKQDSFIGLPEATAPASAPPLVPMDNAINSDGWPKPQQSPTGVVNPFKHYAPAGQDNTHEHEPEVSDDAGPEDEGDAYELGE